MKTKLICAISLVVFLSLACLSGGGDPRDEIPFALSSVCTGDTYTSAAAYSGPSPHPFIIASEDGKAHGWSHQIPEEWFPTSPEATQLVVCLEEWDETVQVCEYVNGPDITRYRTHIDARILEAHTGKTVAQKQFEGSAPRICGATEKYETVSIHGDGPNYDDIEGWLRQYAEGGAQAQPDPKEVSVYCGFLNDSPQYLQPDQQVVLYWNWGTATDEYRQDYINATTFFLRLDAEGVDISGAEQSLHTCEEGGLCVTWRLAPISLTAGTHRVVMRVVLHREITDGFDLDGDGSLDTYGPDDWTADPVCEIVAR